MNRHTGIKPVAPPPILPAQGIWNFFSRRRESQRCPSINIVTSPLSPTVVYPPPSLTNPLSAAHAWKIRMNNMTGAPFVIEKVEDERINEIQMKIVVRVVTLIGPIIAQQPWLWFGIYPALSSSLRLPYSMRDIQFLCVSFMITTDLALCLLSIGFVSC